MATFVANCPLFVHTLAPKSARWKSRPQFPRFLLRLRRRVGHPERIVGGTTERGRRRQAWAGSTARGGIRDRGSHRPGPWHQAPDLPRRGGRLPRRSAEDIKAALDSVHGLLKSSKGGLRAEQIRAALKLDVREMPRVLKEGLATKKLTSKGQKRATTYFAR